MYPKCKLKKSGSNLFMFCCVTAALSFNTFTVLVSTCFFTLSVLMVKSIAMDL